MRRHIPALTLYFCVFLACIALTAVPACSGSQRQKTLHAAILSTSVSYDALVAFDRQHQLDIVAKATSREEGQANLDAYRHKRDIAIGAFVVALTALSIAATHDDEASYRAALRAVSDVVTLATKLAGGS